MESLLTTVETGEEVVKNIQVLLLYSTESCEEGLEGLKTVYSMYTSVDLHIFEILEVLEKRHDTICLRKSLKTRYCALLLTETSYTYCT
jgi:hypothetical protein